MKRTCPWCGSEYDTGSGSSVYCEKNPRRGHKRLAPRLVRIGVLMLKPNPWAMANSRRLDDTEKR